MGGKLQSHYPAVKIIAIDVMTPICVVADCQCGKMEITARSSTSGDGESRVIVVEELLGKVLVEFPFHAQEQMKMRGITEREVLATIRSPSETGLLTQERRERVRKYKKPFPPTKAIDVVYEVHPDRILVVTAFKKFIQE